MFTTISHKNDHTHIHHHELHLTGKPVNRTADDAARMHDAQTADLTSPFQAFRSTVNGFYRRDN